VRPRRPNRNDEATVRSFVDANIGLIYHVANRLAPAYRREADDLVSYGYLGLLRAAEMFDQASGFAFSTYAVPCIRGAIMDGVRKEQPWSTRLERDRTAYQKVARQAEQVGVALTDDDAAAALGWPVGRVLAARTLHEPVPLPDEMLLGLE
jgi:RNA polymerase sigma factor (sigma-70 family)